MCIRDRRGVAIEIGPSALGERLGCFVGRWITGLLHGLGVQEGQPLRIPVGQIISVTDTVKVDVDFGDTPAAVIELSLIHISEPTRLLSISYAVFCLKKKNR